MDERHGDELRTQAADYLEGLTEGFFAYDAEMRIAYVNAAAERTIGRRRPEYAAYQRRTNAFVPGRPRGGDQATS